MPPNGTDIQQARTKSTVYSHILTGTGSSENVMRVERVFILYIPCVPHAIGLSWLMHRSHSLPLSNCAQISFYISKESKQSSLAPSCALSSDSRTAKPLIRVSSRKSWTPLCPSASMRANYKEHFAFLSVMEAYYKHESDSFVIENSVSDYLKKAEERLKEEEDRVERYLHTTTRKLLITECEHVLVHAHAELMWENFQSLLGYDKDEDLQRMYSLLSRIPEGLEPLRRKFEEHVKRTGLAAISKLVGTDPTAIETL
jgi:hypothetical protein